MWNLIRNESDIANFLEDMDYFHDSCIKEMRYFSGAYVDADLSMYPVNDSRTLSIIIQRQAKHFPMIEMEFSRLRYLKLLPTDEAFTCEILDATLILNNGFFYWCDRGGLTEATLNNYRGTVICASKLRWRSIDNYMGQSTFYCSQKEIKID